MHLLTIPRRRLRRLNLGGEMGHACFRFAGTVIFGACLALAHAAGQLADAGQVAIGVGIYLAFGLLWIGVVARSVLTYRVRRVASIVLDQAIFAVALYYGGAAIGPVIWGPVLMVIGNGMRNGAHYARLSTVAGVVSVAVATACSPFWRGIPLVTAGIILAIIALPAYVQLLSAQIDSAKRELKQRAARFESAAKTDSLTGILNRSGFVDALGDLLEQIGNDGNSGAVMLLDLDGFKAINDECGHSTGDLALKRVAALLRLCVRSGDAVARIGGDEFGIALSSGLSRENVRCVAQDLIDTIATLRFPARPDLRLGASIGICLLPDQRFLIGQEIMEEADRLMYQAKRAGKNRFMCSCAEQEALLKQA